MCSAFEVALDLGPFVYRLGRHPFTVQRGVRFPYGLSVEGWMRNDKRKVGEGRRCGGVVCVGDVAQFG